VGGNRTRNSWLYKTSEKRDSENLTPSLREEQC
jgi:hypothetical protein